MSTPTVRPTGHIPRIKADDVPVVTKLWCTIVMIPLTAFMSVSQISFTAMLYDDQGPVMVWLAASALVALASGFMLIARSQYPEVVLYLSCALVVVFPFDSLLVLVALTSLLARRASTRVSARAIAAGTAVALWAQLRDAMHPAKGSLWHLIFAQPGTMDGDGATPVMMAGEAVIVITAVIVTLVAVAISVLVGLHIRSRATLRKTKAKAIAASTHAEHLQSSLDNQQLADAIAAEAHDTLAHSLSLIAVNASALQAQTARLTTHADSVASDDELAADIASTASDIRRQAAGALDEAHSVIDMLRNPQTARETLVPTSDTALTREALDVIIADARESGMRLDTWIDIQQLSHLDEHVGKIAYRIIQEGLTNARRHASGMSISLEVMAMPRLGVHVHMSNPIVNPDAADANDPPVRDAAVGGKSTHGKNAQTQEVRHGAGLPGIVARVRSVGGDCHYGLDERGLFHLDATIPWREIHIPTDVTAGQ